MCKSPEPEEPLVEQLSCTNGRGQRLHVLAVTPAATTALRCSLVYAHGYAEHSGRKLAAFKQLAAAGIAVYTYDMASFGQSEPLEPSSRALIWDYTHLADDLCDVAAFARQQHTAAGRPAVPWFIGGFSLGGLTAVHAVLRPEQQGGLWRGLVLVSACMWVKMTLLTRVQRLVGPLLNYAMPKAQIVQRLDPLHELHPDPHEAADYEADPLVIHSRTRVSTAFQMGKSLFAMRRVRHRLELPLYAVHATRDSITPFKDLAEFMHAVASKDKTLKTVTGGYHDLLAGAGAAPYVEDIAAWMLKRAGGKA